MRSGEGRDARRADRPAQARQERQEREDGRPHCRCDAPLTDDSLQRLTVLAVPRSAAARRGNDLRRANEQGTASFLGSRSGGGNGKAMSRPATKTSLLRKERLLLARNYDGGTSPNSSPEPKADEVSCAAPGQCASLSAVCTARVSWLKRHYSASPEETVADLARLGTPPASVAQPRHHPSGIQPLRRGYRIWA